MRVPALDALIQFVGHSADAKGLDSSLDLTAALTQFYAGLDASKLGNVAKMVESLGVSAELRRDIMTKLCVRSARYSFSWT